MAAAVIFAMPATNDLRDALGTRHAPAEAESRIVSLVPSLTELLCDLGLAGNLVGRSGFCIHPRETVKRIPKMGGTKDADIAKIRAAAKLADDFRAAREELRRAVDHLPRERVLYLVWKDPWMTVSRATYISAMLAAAGWDTLPEQSEARYPVTDAVSQGLTIAERVLLSTEPYRFTGKHLAAAAARFAVPARLTFRKGRRAVAAGRGSCEHCPIFHWNASMYIPASFRESRIEVMHALMRAHPFGLLVSAGAGGLQATPIPFLLEAGEGGHGTLRAHLARANPHWRELASAEECLVVFQGEQGYVTPSWYAGKAVTHKAVPTWNYAAVHAWGRPRVIEDAAWLRRQIEALTRGQEARRAQPWAVGDAPDDYIAAQMQAIVGIEIPIARIEGKWKMSQNRDEADRLGVVRGLRDGDDPHRNLPLAEQVERRLKG